MTAKFLAIVIAVVIWIAGAAPAPVAQPESTVLATPTPTINPQPAAGDWVYPNSTQLDTNKWRSSADPGVITDWYKSKIEALGMNAKSFVQTNTNGQVLNKLVAADGKRNILVEISQSSADNQTSILVVLDN